MSLISLGCESENPISNTLAPHVLTSALVSRYSKLMMTSDHQLTLITQVLEVNNWHFCPAPPTDQFLGDPTCSDQCSAGDN